MFNVIVMLSQVLMYDVITMSYMLKIIFYHVYYNYVFMMLCIFLWQWKLSQCFENIVTTLLSWWLMIVSWHFQQMFYGCFYFVLRTDYCFKHFLQERWYFYKIFRHFLWMMFVEYFHDIAHYFGAFNSLSKWFMFWWGFLWYFYHIRCYYCHVIF